MVDESVTYTQGLVITNKIHKKFFEFYENVGAAPKTCILSENYAESLLEHLRSGPLDSMKVMIGDITDFRFHDMQIVVTKKADVIEVY